MKNFVQREFIVDIPLEVAWDHFAKVEKWPSWAKHIKQIELEPPGAITSTSKGTLHLKNGIKSTFKIVVYNHHQNWQWTGPFLWMTIGYDHTFEAINETQTKLTFLVDGAGFGSAIMGRLFALIYNRNLDVAIPNLIAEMNVLR